MLTGFERLLVRGYRRLRDLDLTLRPLNVLIGANGVGKTSILEVIDLLAASAEGTLESTLSQAGGISSVLTLDGVTDSMQLSLRMPVEGEPPINYEVDFSVSGVGYQISSENLIQQQNITAKNPFNFISSRDGRIKYYDVKGKKLTDPNWNYKYNETALSQVPKMFQKAETFRHFLGDTSEIYHALDVSSRAPVRLPQSIQPAKTPGSDGEDLFSCLYSIRETDRDRFEAIEDALRAVFPTFERIDLPPVAAGSLTLAWKDKNLSKPIYPHQLSEGTLRFLWLVTLLQSPELPSVTLIDEPEVSLHPEMLRLLAELMREASQRTQLIVATHSDRFIRFLDPEELVVCDSGEDGSTTARRASDLDLGKWMADYSLDELWAMGRIGGRM
jgi:predicted ATPase